MARRHGHTPTREQIRFLLSRGKNMRHANRKAHEARDMYLMPCMVGGGPRTGTRPTKLERRFRRRSRL